MKTTPNSLMPFVTRAALGVIWLALLAGVVIYAIKPRHTLPLKISPPPDTREVAYEEARQMVLNSVVTR